MSVRHPDQGIEQPLRKIVEGIKEFRGAVSMRIESGDWTYEHLEEIERLSRKLSKRLPLISKLARENW